MLSPLIAHFPKIAHSPLPINVGKYLNLPRLKCDFLQFKSLNALTVFRILFGIVWIINGAMKFVFFHPYNIVIVNMIKTVSQGQPAWLQGWFNFWVSTVSSSPVAFLYMAGAIELALGLALIAGFLRKIVYVAGILDGLLIWSIFEGFGGPYGVGSTDVGTAIPYIFVFILLIIAETTANYSKYSLDAVIERKWKGWSRLAELHKDEAQ